VQAYEGSTIRVAAHTSGAQAPDEESEVALQLAKTVEQYLASALRRRYRWVSVGYGSTRPLVAVDNLENQARNRRIEIAVD
jgi:outer membrane protein OmpA-like peptidoglycan-associated protein